MVHNGVLDNGVEILSKPFTVNGWGGKVTQILQQA